jgi:DNA primase large subunit
VEHVTAADVDELAASAFPLCMANMHASLKERHKLKHLGRLQYGLFLKGVGLPVEEALLFWQKEFTKGMSADEFLKKVGAGEGRGGEHKQEGGEARDDGLAVQCDGKSAVGEIARPAA